MIFVGILLLMWLPFIIGCIALFITGKNNNSRSPVLLLHTITGGHHAHFSHYSPQKFSKLISEIRKNNFQSRTLSFIASNPYNQSDLAITFDDGFESFYSQALHTLNENSMRVTVFPIAGYIGKSSQWDVLPCQPHLNRQQIREVSDLGHEIGSHTLTHANLVFLNDSDLMRELVDSKHILEDVIGKPIVSLSFPFGSWNQRVWEKAKEAGYVHGTCYRHHKKILDGLLPVYGIYSFDTVQDVMDKIKPTKKFSNAYARGKIVSHFAKGTPLWKFEPNYALFR